MNTNQGALKTRDNGVCKVPPPRAHNRTGQKGEKRHPATERCAAMGAWADKTRSKERACSCASCITRTGTRTHTTHTVPRDCHTQMFPTDQKAILHPPRTSQQSAFYMYTACTANKDAVLLSSPPVLLLDPPLTPYLPGHLESARDMAMRTFTTLSVASSAKEGTNS